MQEAAMSKTRILKISAAVFAALLFAPVVWGRQDKKALFKYVAGTEALPKGCGGELEVTESALVFLCDGKSVSVPYDAISQMEFLPRVSKKIRKMKLHWEIKPGSSHGKHAGFFSVIYSGGGQTRAIVLKVPNDTMRPYMAEIDLKTGHNIESRTDN